MVNIHFSDFFQVDPNTLERYGAFNISVINDLPLFIDPFLLFNSTKPEYRQLHDSMITYLRFLRDKSDEGIIQPGLLESWYRFPEVRQNWFGYSLVGNKGSGLGIKFARAMRENLAIVFSNFGAEQITLGSHLEKLCLIEKGVGRDNISDFTTNLIKYFLLDYTQTFALNYIESNLCKKFTIRRVRFNYDTQTWMTGAYTLPYLGDDFVLLTPKDILTKDDGWINRKDLYGDFETILNSVSNEQLRAQLNNYLLQTLPKDATPKVKQDIILRAIRKYPEYIEHFIRYKEDCGDKAQDISKQRVAETQRLFVKQVDDFANRLTTTGFYSIRASTIFS